MRAARRGGPRVGGRVCEGVGVSEFVWVTRKARAAIRARSHTRGSPTPTATRAPNTLPLTGTLAGRLCRPRTITGGVGEAAREGASGASGGGWWRCRSRSPRRGKRGDGRAGGRCRVLRRTLSGFPWSRWRRRALPVVARAREGLARPRATRGWQGGWQVPSAVQNPLRVPNEDVRTSRRPTGWPGSCLVRRAGRPGHSSREWSR